MDDFSKARVGERPYIIIGYSMGGLLTRHMVATSEKARSNLKGIVFVASPLKGSTLNQQVNDDLRGIIPVGNH